METTALDKARKMIYGYYAEGLLTMQEADALVERAREKQEEAVQSYTQDVMRIVWESL